MSRSIKTKGLNNSQSVKEEENIIDNKKEKEVKLETPVDWKPQEKCYFCVDGKLLTVNDKGEVVAETGPPPSEPVLAKIVSFMSCNNTYVFLIQCLLAHEMQPSVESDSDSSECSDTEVISHSGRPNAKSIQQLLLQQSQHPNMTSFESMAAQLATIASLNGYPPMYQGMFVSKRYIYEIFNQKFVFKACCLIKLFIKCKRPQLLSNRIQPMKKRLMHRTSNHWTLVLNIVFLQHSCIMMQNMFIGK